LESTHPLHIDSGTGREIVPRHPQFSRVRRRFGLDLEQANSPMIGEFACSMPRQHYAIQYRHTDAFSGVTASSFGRWTGGRKASASRRKSEPRGNWANPCRTWPRNRQTKPTAARGALRFPRRRLIPDPAPNATRNMRQRMVYLRNTGALDTIETAKDGLQNGAVQAMSHLFYLFGTQS
jgi:hypothetical protein